MELPECQYSRGHPQYVQNVELVNVNAIVQDAVEKNGEMTTVCAGCFCAGAGRLYLSMFFCFIIIASPIIRAPFQFSFYLLLVVYKKNLTGKCVKKKLSTKYRH